MRVLITGGAGFIGSHLTNAFIAQGDDVFVLDNLSAGKRENVNDKATFFEMDMGDQRLAEVFEKVKPEYVYHLAFNTDAPRSVREPWFDAYSIVGSANVFAQCAAHNVKKVIFVSSGFVYGNAQTRPAPEDTPLVPSSPYSVSKAATENYLKYFNINFGLPYVILRFATIFGPRQSGRAMDYYIQCIKDGKSANMWGDGTKTRDYVYVDDAIAALMKAREIDVPSGIDPVFNISSEKETSLNDLYATLAKLIGNPESRPTYLPDRPGEIVKFCLNSTKGRQHFKWEPKVSFEEGLAKTIAYYFS